MCALAYSYNGLEPPVPGGGIPSGRIPFLVVISPFLASIPCLAGFTWVILSRDFWFYTWVGGQIFVHLSDNNIPFEEVGDGRCAFRYFFVCVCVCFCVCVLVSPIPSAVYA